MTLAMEADEAIYPEDILIFDADGVMSRPDAGADLIEPFRRGGGFGCHLRCYISLRHEFNPYDSGEWKDHRSSRLGLQWRVIYRVVANVLQIQVVQVTAHDYRRP
jgi:hypothetical protein